MQDAASRREVDVSRRGRRGRRWAVLLLLVALALGVVACGGDDDSSGGSSGDIASEQVIFADYGGTTRSANRGAYFTPFEQETGVRVVSADADASKLELFAENKRADWDLIDMDAWDIVRFADQGLLAKLPDSVPRSDSVPEKYRDYAIGGYNSSVVLAYNTEKVKPRSWADFFDTEKFPGKRALPPFPLLEVFGALLADGVACEDLYPIDLDRAFAKLDEIRDDVLVYDSFGQGQQFLLQGSAVMAALPNGRIQPVKDQGLPLDYLWTDALRVPWVAAVIPRHAPHKDAAFALLESMNEPEHQSQFARMTNYGPMNTDALELVDEETQAKLPNAPANAEQQCEVDPVALAGQWDEYAARHAEWLTSL
jgi:putative spermidine/putrescine transport system substrate-binding protein